MFKEEIPKRECITKDGYELIKTLKKKLVFNVVVEQNDALDDCIIQMFGEEEELENTEISIHDDYTNIPDQEDNNEELICDNSNENIEKCTSSCVPKISIGNVFLLGRQKMIEMKIPHVRERKKSRISRSRAFFLDINDTVLKMEDEIDGELDRITNVTLFEPWYRLAYRAIGK